MKSDHEIVNAVWKSLEVKRQARPGIIIADCQPFNEPEPAIAAFINFGGAGWLCTADSAPILQFTDIAKEPPATSSWPRFGELVNGCKSMHLRYTGNCWILATLSENVSAANGIILKTSFAGLNGQMLDYDVSYVNEDRSGLREYRPHLCRFLGFRLGEMP